MLLFPCISTTYTYLFSVFFPFLAFQIFVVEEHVFSSLDYFNYCYCVIKGKKKMKRRKMRFGKGMSIVASSQSCINLTVLKIFYLTLYSPITTFFFIFFILRNPITTYHTSFFFFNKLTKV